MAWARGSDAARLRLAHLGLDGGPLLVADSFLEAGQEGGLGGPHVRHQVPLAHGGSDGKRPPHPAGQRCRRPRALRRQRTLASPNHALGGVTRGRRQIQIRGHLGGRILAATAVAKRESARRSPWPLAAKVSRELMAAGQPRCQRTAAPRAARWSDGCAHGGNPSSTQSAGARVQPLLTCAPFPALHTLLCPCWRLVSVTRGRTLALSTCCMLPRFRLSRREGNPALRRGIFKANCNPSVYNSSHFIRQDFLNS